MLTEAQLAKSLFKIAAARTRLDDFVRDFDSVDDANAFLNHGNYLAYGLAASALGAGHTTDSPSCGKTRRGALVFDVADLVKDALILPGLLSAPGRK